MCLEVLQLDLGGAFGGFGDVADDPWLLTGGAQFVQGSFDLILGDADDHADAAVQHAVHFMLVDVAFFLQEVEYHRALPAGDVNHGLGVFGSTRGMLSSRPPPVMWAMAFTAPVFLISCNSGLT